MVTTTARFLTGLAVAGLATLAVAPAAVAAPPGPGCKPVKGKPAYPPGQCKKAATSDSTPGVGEDITVDSGEGEFTDGTDVNVTFESKTIALGTVKANSAGLATITFKVPSVAAGTHHVVFRGDFLGTPNTVSVTLQVHGAAAAGAGLPFTGFELGAASLLGAGLLGAGTVAVVSGRKRKTGLSAA